MFLWCGLAPFALVAWVRRREEDSAKAATGALLALWFGLSFALFSAMPTKFHHYILPAVPPVAMLTGILLDDMISAAGPAAAGEAAKRRFQQALHGAVAVCGALSVIVVGADLAETREGLPNQIRLLQLFTVWARKLSSLATICGPR